MDKFVKQAFKDAENAVLDDEYKAWERAMKDPDIPHMAVAEAVGMERINELCRVALATKTANTLADYAHILMLTGFHLGYHARREEEGCQDR